MVASISARKSVAAAVAYFKHMAQDEYYTGEYEADGEWSGRGADRLALEGPVMKTDFEAALNGHDPRTGEPLTQIGKAHAPGWDMTFSAPKSVSVMWALSSKAERAKIEAAHQQAVRVATSYLEDNHAYTRRGKAGAIREPVVGLTIAQFHHHTSRDLDPQLHTHAFIFNTAPRQDGSWGTIVSRDLYKAQKEAGAVYRQHLGNALERQGYAVERKGTGIRLKAIPHTIERAFSKRRQAIEQAVATHGYRTPKGMELAALRTRQTKRPRERAALFKAWAQEARTLGFSLERTRQVVAGTHRSAATQNLQPRAEASKAIAPSIRQMVAFAVTALRGSSRMPGVAVRLRQVRPEQQNEHEL